MPCSLFRFWNLGDAVALRRGGILLPRNLRSSACRGATLPLLTCLGIDEVTWHLVGEDEIDQVRTIVREHLFDRRGDLIGLLDPSRLHPHPHRDLRETDIRVLDVERGRE